MSFTSWLRKLSSVSPPNVAARGGSRRLSRALRAKRRPQLEALEDRVTPSTLVVSTALDVYDGGTAADPAGADGALSLREAISAAVSGDEITFDSALNGSLINLDPNNGELLIDKNLVILGPGAGNLAVSGQNSMRVFNVALGVTSTISGLTIENGNASLGFGGGISNAGTLVLNGSSLTNNAAFDGYGGAIYNSGALTVNDSTLSRNASFYGGAIASFGTLTVAGSSLFDNQADDAGGALFTYGYLEYEGALNVTDTTLFGNYAGNRGGAIANFFGDTTISDTTLSGNTSFFEGGGIWDNGTLTVHRCTLAGNSALNEYGGGIWTANTAAIIGSTLSSNSARLAGGGIYNPGGTMTIQSSIVAGNSCPRGPDLESAAATLSNTLLGDNRGATGLIETSPGAFDASGNLIGGPRFGIIDALLAPLAYNGGPTQTMALQPGSPALDSGANPQHEARDQRGFPFVRTAGIQTDMGAFELQQRMFAPKLSILSPGGAFSGQRFPAVATVAGVGGPLADSLQGVYPTLTYYAGTYTGPGDDGTSLPGAPTNAGVYTVVAAFAGSAEYTAARISATFTITQALPAFSALASPTVLVGTSSVNVGGVINWNAFIPTGAVSIVINGSRVSASIQPDGTFSATLPTRSLTPGSYTITYVYGGDVNFQSIVSTQTLTIQSAQQEIVLIVDKVTALVAGTVLESGAGLTEKLTAAIASLNRDNTTAGVNQLNAFIKQTNALVRSGRLGRNEAKILISAVEDAIAAALGSKIV